MTTLADMAPEERAQCRGMWAQTQDELGVLLTTDGVLGAVWIPHAFNWLTQPLGAIELLTDLPRAWNADGTPPEADWQYAEYRPGVNRGFYSIEEAIEKGPEMAEGTTMARRWVGEWEEV